MNPITRRKNDDSKGGNSVITYTLIKMCPEICAQLLQYINSKPHHCRAIKYIPLFKKYYETRYF